MLVTHLSLQNFRNYTALDLALAPGPTVLWGDNAQGKTNLLEAVYLLSTGRSPRATADREFMTRCLPPEALPMTRLAAEVQRAAGPLKLELVLLAQDWADAARGGKASAPLAAGSRVGSGGNVQKRVRVNGTPRRLLDLVGQLPAVLFSPEDLELVTGSPVVRRRALDITLSQLDPGYARTLQRYQRVVLQRNHLLRLVHEGQAQERELAFWDGALLDLGAAIVWRRLQELAGLAPLASAIQAQLTGGRDILEARYAAAAEAVLPEAGAGTPTEVRAGLAAALERARRRELAQGQTVVGPHRDDLHLLVNGAAVGAFGSRGQQRTTALALKLAEAEHLRRQTGDDPVLLLDDVLSEMDSERRTALAAAARSFQQVLITTTDPAQFPANFLADATCYRVVAGRVEPR
ncbi:MAG: DNA replication/repair protein RecF [Chloroflexi bacterium]|nr:DNA replication/repair protein RecF [Chloroflexota bacterium]